MNSGPLLPRTSSTDYAQFLATPISFAIDMEFCTDPLGRQANTPEHSIALPSSPCTSSTDSLQFLAIPINFSNTWSFAKQTLPSNA